MPCYTTKNGDVKRFLVANIINIDTVDAVALLVNGQIETTHGNIEELDGV